MGLSLSENSESTDSFPGGPGGAGEAMTPVHCFVEVSGKPFGESGVLGLNAVNVVMESFRCRRRSLFGVPM